MNTDVPEIPTAEEAVSSQISVLERTASGLRDAFDALRAYAAAFEDGKLRFRAAAPVGTSLPEPIAPSADSDLKQSISKAMVMEWSGPLEPFTGGTTLIVPLVARGEVYGSTIIVFREGSEVPDTGVLALVGSKAGSALAALHDCRDLAERVSQMSDSAHVLEALVDASHDAVKILDLDGCVLRWNKGCEEVYGWSEAEVIGEKMPHVPEELRIKAVQDLRVIASEGRVCQREVAAVGCDGTGLMMGVTVIPVTDGDGHPSSVVTVSRVLAKELPAERPTSDIASLASREIKGPLTAVVGYAQLLGRVEILGDRVRRTRTIHALEEHSAELNEVLDDLTLVAQIHEGTLHLDLQQADLTGLVADVVARVEQSSSAHRFLVDFDSHASRVALDQSKVSRVLEGLLQAIMRYAGEAETTVRVGPDGPWAVVSVTMKGDPATNASIAGVLDTFSHMRSHGIPAEGTVRLLLAREIVKAHGGRASVHRTAAGGVFTLRFPRSSV